MRVSIIGINYWPEATGNAPYTTGLAEGLTGMGWDVHVVTAYPHYPAWKISRGYKGARLAETISGVSVKRNRHYVPAQPTGTKRLMMELSFGIKTILANWGKPEVIILVSPALFSVAMAQIKSYLSRPRIPVIVWVHDIYTRGVQETGVTGSSGTKIVKRIEAAVFRRADTVVVIHDRFRRYLIESLGVESSKIEARRFLLNRSPPAWPSSSRPRLGSWLPRRGCSRQSSPGSARGALPGRSPPQSSSGL